MYVNINMFNLAFEALDTMFLGGEFQKEECFHFSQSPISQ